MAGSSSPIFSFGMLTKAVAIGILILIVVLLVGAGGAFRAAFDLGGLVAKVPVWFWLLIGILWLINQARRN
jgi:hypothetical protein